MKLVCQKNSLLKGLNTVSKAVPQRTTNEILRCIVFETLDNELKLTANDQSYGIETRIEASIEEDGAIAVESFSILNLIRSLPEDSIIIESKNNDSLKISCENIVCEIPCRSIDDFIKLPEIEAKGTVKVSQFTIHEMINKVIFAAAKSDNNPAMNGIYIEILNNYIRMTALDGHKVAIRKYELKENYENYSAIVPQNPLNDLSKIISGEQDEEMTISFAKNHIVFEFENTKLISRIINGEYFKIDKLLSSSFNTKFELNTKKFFDSITRSVLFTDESNKKPLVLTIEDECIKLNLNSVRGKMDDQIDIEKEGQSLKIAFDPKLLMDVIRVIEDEKITLYMIDKKSPCTIKTDDERYNYLVLPLSFVEE